MKIVKYLLLVMFFIGCAKQVNLYPEGITKELITIDIPSANIPLEISKGSQGARIILNAKFNRLIDEFEQHLNPKKIRYALHVSKLVEGVRYDDTPRNIVEITNSLNATVLHITHPYIASTKPNRKWNTKIIRRGSVSFYYQCTYTDQNDKMYTGPISNKLVVPALFKSN